MIKIFLFLVLITNTLTAQISYYYATGKDSVTYVATSIGLMVLTRDENEQLVFHSIVNDSNKIYKRGLDNEHFLVFSTDSQIDMYSLANKYSPSFIGTLYFDKIISIRPFGNHFAILRSNGFTSSFEDQYIVGLDSDSLKILSSLKTYESHYTSRTMFTPEVVYPYFFCTPDYSQRLMMYRFSEENKTLTFVDSFAIFSSDYSIGQMWGGKDRLYIREIKWGYSSWFRNEKKIEIGNDSLIILSISSGYLGHWFTDEIESSDTLIRFNGSYTFLNGIALSEPKRYLSGSANLSGIKIYLIKSSSMYYSTNIIGTTINSAQFVYEPSSVDEPSEISNFSLAQNYPNPFNPVTKITYAIPLLGGARGGFVTLKVYEVLGNEVATLVNEHQPAGNYEVDFHNLETRHGVSLPSGVYFYQLRAGDFVETKKMILLR